MWRLGILQNKKFWAGVSSILQYYNNVGRLHWSPYRLRDNAGLHNGRSRIIWWCTVTIEQRLSRRTQTSERGCIQYIRSIMPAVEVQRMWLSRGSSNSPPYYDSLVAANTITAIVRHYLRRFFSRASLPAIETATDVQTLAKPGCDDHNVAELSRCRDNSMCSSRLSSTKPSMNLRYVLFLSISFNIRSIFLAGGLL